MSYQENWLQNTPEYRSSFGLTLLFVLLIMAIFWFALTWFCLWLIL